MRNYLRNLSLWLRGIRWLWTHNSSRLVLVTQIEGCDWYIRKGGFWSFPAAMAITYKPGWGPWRFLPIYLTTYLAGTLAGYGVVSLSRAWYDRSVVVILDPQGRIEIDGDRWTAVYPFARFMTRLLDWAFPGSRHGRHTGPRLWGSVNLRDKP